MLLASVVVTYAQNTVRGVVISATDQEPIIGATVLEKGSLNGTVTDLDGQFTLSVKNNAVLVVSYVGFSTQEMAQKTEVDEATYIRYETGEVDLPFTFIHKCALALGIERLGKRGDEQHGSALRAHRLDQRITHRRADKLLLGRLHDMKGHGTSLTTYREVP